MLPFKKDLIMKKILITLIIIGIGLSLVYIGLQGHFYRVLLEERLVGIIKCARSTDRNYDFYLFYYPIESKNVSEFKFIKLKGKEWTFEGEIIKWKGLLNFIGVKTASRPIKIYDSLGNSYSLEKKPPKFAFQIEKILPVIDTTYISAVKCPFIPKSKFGIYITNTGYLLRKIR